MGVAVVGGVEAEVQRTWLFCIWEADSLTPPMNIDR